MLMLAIGEVVVIEALAGEGWTVSAIARHVGRDRRTVRAYLRDDRRPGRRRPVADDGLASFLPYVRARLADEPEVPAVVLYRELVGRGYERSYPTLTARLRRLGLRALTCDPVADQKVHDQTPELPRPNPITVLVPADPPALGPESARALLRILRKATSRPA